MQKKLNNNFVFSSKIKIRPREIQIRQICLSEQLLQQCVTFLLIRKKEISRLKKIEFFPIRLSSENKSLFFPTKLSGLKTFAQFYFEPNLLKRICWLNFFLVFNRNWYDIKNRKFPKAS